MDRVILRCRPGVVPARPGQLASQYFLGSTATRREKLLFSSFFSIHFHNARLINRF
jgi:hypothetical protein